MAAAIVIAVSVLIGLAASASAIAGTTAASTFTKSGSDASTGSTVTSGGAVGTTAAGDTINWVLHYRNTTGAVAQTDITDAIGGNQSFVPGSLKTPPGLAPQWSTNGGGTYAGAEPAAGVDAVGATGGIVDGATGGQVQSLPATSGFVAAGAGGDGWEAIFIGANIYNIHHHAGVAISQIDCHVKTTGANCPGYPATFISQNAGDPLGTGLQTLITSNQPSAMVRGTKIYFPAGVNNTTSVGVGCVDVAANTSCGYTQLGSAAVNSVGATAQISGGAVVGAKYYLIGDQAQIYCYDASTQAACAGYPLVGVADPTFVGDNISAHYSHLEAFGNGRYVFGNLRRANDTRDLTCIDTTTDASCPGFPKVAYGGLFNPGATGLFNSVQAPILDAAGNVTGICGGASPNTASHPFVCFDLTGTAVPTPWTQQIPNTVANGWALGGVLRIGARLYFAETVQATGVATYTCWDFVTASPCAGFVPGSSGASVQTYTLRQDPQNPDCIWQVGNSGIFEVFSATFGGTACNESPANVELNPSQYYCDGQSGHVTAWNRLRISGITPADYTALALTITNDNGNPVPGWSSRVFPNTTTSIDISGIPHTGANAHLHFNLSFNNLATGKTATVTATFTGDPAQVCFKTVVGKAACAATPLISNAGNAVTVGANAVSDGPGGNGSGTASFRQAADPSLCRADLAIVKTARQSPAIPGQNLTYDLKVTNNGPDTAVTPTVSDPLPAGETFVSASSGCSGAGGVVTCALPSLAAGTSQTIQVVTKVASSVTRALVNTATVTSPTTKDPDPSNNTSTERVPVGPKVDLELTKKASLTTVPAGGQVMYTLVVENHGPSDATGVTVSDPPPAGLSMVSAKPSQGTCTTAGAVSCSLGSLADGGSAQILVTANVAASVSGPLTNTATVTGDQPDPTPPNNTGTSTVTVKPPPPDQPVADVQIVKHVDRALIPLGQKLIYTLTVTNNGPGTAPGVAITDTPSLTLTVLSVKASQGSCKTGPPITCTLGALVAGASAKVTIVAQPKSTGTEANSASVTSEARDPKPDNNVSTARTTITRAALLLSKTARRSVNAGQNRTYRLRVTNPTSLALSNVRVCDQLPRGLVYVSAAPEPRLTGGRYCWTIARLGAKRSQSVHLTAKALAGARGTLVNHATASAAGVRAARAQRSVAVRPQRARPTPVTG